MGKTAFLWDGYLYYTDSIVLSAGIRSFLQKRIDKKRIKNRSEWNKRGEIMYIEVKNLTKRIENITILDSINLQFDQGRIYGLKGKNGSGKTMLIKAICGLIRPSQGEIIVDGMTLGRNQEFPKSVGALIENPGFIDHYSGYKNLKLLADIKGEIGEDEIRTVMKELGLDPDEKKRVKKYSLGMKQKLGIAAAVMEHPKLILLDEPTNALDTESVEKFNDLIQKEKKRNAVILIASHDTEELKGIADQIFVIENGRIKKEEQL